MGILNFVADFNFHDSFIENIGSVFFKDQLIITIDFCNWQQLTYSEGQPEHIIGNFIFSGVKDIVLDVNVFTLNNNNILNVKYERDGLDDSVSIVFGIPEAPEVAILSFKAESVIWKPIVTCSV